MATDCDHRQGHATGGETVNPRHNFKPEVAKKLAALLRSGELRQARNFLRISGRFCVAGALCELYHRETGRGEWRNALGDPFIKEFTEGGLRSRYNLIEPVSQWALADEQKAQIDQKCLQGLNDEAFWTFEQFAEALEA